MRVSLFWAPSCRYHSRCFAAQAVRRSGSLTGSGRQSAAVIHGLLIGTSKLNGIDLEPSKILQSYPAGGGLQTEKHLSSGEPDSVDSLSAVD